MIDEREWAVIRRMVESVSGKISGRRQDFFITGTVVKSDLQNNLIWIKEFGDQPIPVVGFDYDVTYYDTDNTGVVRKKTARVKVHVPRRGETVLVARELGIQRLPRCLGVIQGQGWIQGE
jgi:hypothetical protein